MPAKGYWDKDNKGLTIKGMQWDADFEEFKHKNARDRELRRKISDWLDKNHDALISLWYNSMDVRMHELRKQAKEMNVDDAVALIRDNIRLATLQGWFINADSDYKPSIIGSVLSKDGLLNATWNVAYNAYKYVMREENKKPLPFMKWLYTPQTLYRGHREQEFAESDHWVSYSFDKRVGDKFAGQTEKSQVSMIKIRPIDTFGSFNTSAEAEVAVPRWRIKMRTK